MINPFRFNTNSLTSFHVNVGLTGYVKNRRPNWEFDSTKLNPIYFFTYIVVVELDMDALLLG